MSNKHPFEAVSGHEIMLPSDLCAPAVSMLKSRKVLKETVLAMMLEMCQKGNLEVGRRLEDFYLAPGEPSDRPWEQRLLKDMPASVKISDLQVNYLQDGIGEDLGEYLWSRGIFAENPWRASKVSPTEEGAQEIKNWDGFKKQLGSMNPDRHALTTAQFDAYLPYSVAMGGR